MSVATDVEQFLTRELVPDMDTVPPDLDLLADGRIDSVGILQLITFLEERYGIKVLDDELAPENFRSIESIVGFVEGKRG
jgi:acyl carrier protein